MITTRHNHAGYSIVEVLMAITILLIATAAPLTIASKGLQSAYYARDQLTAYMLAQEGIEFVIGARNAALITSIKNNELDKTWAWTEDLTIAPCFKTNGGCNTSLSKGDNDPFLPANVADCSVIEDCIMEYKADTSDPAHYYVDTQDDINGEVTPFTRVITLEEIVTDKEIQITSTVSWQPRIFSTAQEIVLTTSIFNTYGE